MLSLFYILILLVQDEMFPQFMKDDWEDDWEDDWGVCRVEERR